MAGHYGILVLKLLILLPCFNILAQNFEKLQLKEGSKIWLEGKTNISQYHCSIDSFRFEADGTFRHETVDKDSLVIQPDHLSLTLYVSSIQCGNRLMNRDVRQALNYPEDREIVYTYKGLDVTPKINNIYTWNKLEIKGILEIKNIQNQAFFPIQVKHLENHRFHVKGKHTIDMLRYNVEPPSGLNGIIQARRKLTVHFDIVIGLESQQISSNNFFTP